MQSYIRNITLAPDRLKAAAHNPLAHVKRLDDGFGKFLVRVSKFRPRSAVRRVRKLSAFGFVSRLYMRFDRPSKLLGLLVGQLARRLQSNAREMLDSRTGDRCGLRRGQFLTHRGHSLRIESPYVNSPRLNARTSAARIPRGLAAWPTRPLRAICRDVSKNLTALTVNLLPLRRAVHSVARHSRFPPRTCARWVGKMTRSCGSLTKAKPLRRAAKLRGRYSARSPSCSSRRRKAGNSGRRPLAVA